MNIKFILQPGKNYKYQCKLKHTYKISCDIFKNHNHKSKPLIYYYDGQKPTDVVITVESNDPLPYFSPYSETIEKWLIVARAHVIFHCHLTKNNVVEVEIEEDK